MTRLRPTVFLRGSCDHGLHPILVRSVHPVFSSDRVVKHHVASVPGKGVPTPNPLPPPDSTCVKGALGNKDITPGPQTEILLKVPGRYYRGAGNNLNERKIILSIIAVPERTRI